VLTCVIFLHRVDRAETIRLIKVSSTLATIIIILAVTGDSRRYRRQFVAVDFDATMDETTRLCQTNFVSYTPATSPVWMRL